MRIVGGKFRGRILSEFKGKDVRPTSDMVRESLFNILQFKIIDCSFLDLFCGTGAVGLEALSRGAKSVVFNDLEKSSIDIVKKNIAKLDIKEGVSVYNSDGIAFLERGKKFDYIFIDPPYKSGLGLTAIERADKCLETDGTIIFEDEKPFNESIDGLTIIDRRKYGRAYLTFFKRTSDIK